MGWEWHTRLSKSALLTERLREAIRRPRPARLGNLSKASVPTNRKPNTVRSKGRTNAVRTPHCPKAGLLTTPLTYETYVTRAPVQGQGAAGATIQSPQGCVRRDRWLTSTSHPDTAAARPDGTPLHGLTKCVPEGTNQKVGPVAHRRCLGEGALGYGFHLRWDLSTHPPLHCLL